MVMRGCLESALYGLYINRDPALMAIWLSRHDGEEERKLVRSVFQIGKMWTCLAEVDPNLRPVAEILYNKTIDQGAHPNVSSMSLALTIVRQEAKTQFTLAYLTEDRAVIEGAMKSVAQVGVVVLDVFRWVLRDRFDLLGVTTRLESLRRGL